MQPAPSDRRRRLCSPPPRRPAPSGSRPMSISPIRSGRISPIAGSRSAARFRGPARDCRAIRGHRGEFLAGALGPDVFPDVLVGQAIVHPGVARRPAGERLARGLCSPMRERRGDRLRLGLCDAFRRRRLRAQLRQQLCRRRLRDRRQPHQGDRASPLPAREIYRPASRLSVRSRRFARARAPSCRAAADPI